MAIGLGGEDFSQQGADEANRAVNARRDDPRGARITVLPNGQRVRLDDVVDPEYLQGDHSSIFADPSKYIAEEFYDAEAMYVWPVKDDPKMFGKIRSSMYEPVPIEHINQDTELPIETHVSAGINLVCCYDLALMKVPPAAVKRLYKWRESLALARTNSHEAFSELRNRVRNASGGNIDADIRVKESSRDSE